MKLFPNFEVPRSTGKEFGRMNKFAAIGLVLILAVASATAERKLINTDRSGVALKGYDPVAYFKDNRAVRGNSQFQSSLNGATYYFASAENKKTFDGNPRQYEPQFGGFCAYAVSQGHTAKIDPEAFEILNGRLLLQYDKGVRDLFNKDQQGNLTKADRNWPGLVEKEGR
jgi:YHS domain-containing protein